jgi:hypothetical protein
MSSRRTCQETLRLLGHVSFSDSWIDVNPHSFGYTEHASAAAALNAARQYF